MDKSGPIIVIEDNEGDQRIFEEIFEKMKFKNKLLFFDDGEQALEYFHSTEDIPFLVISDINMPRMNGFELRNKIQENKELSRMCVPFLFFSTGGDKNSVEKAYALSVQGFFRKPNGIDELGNTLLKIIEYWKECVAPSDYNE
ncbi:MAG: response regulator [Bacteroidia bacterium]